ncbi:hypothetical protein [Azohydromonas australica]|uniref:hypothetical protein n=1 Tax=Azohydromonas australica TaxID=364039 RepID=UPI0012EB49C8|nr:hypothetical protein [Azohydromonas australica]
MLALVGPGWLRAAASSGSRRLDDPHDFVRREIELALAHGKPLIPVLLEGTRMPGPQNLPPSMQHFARCQAVVLANDRWNADTATLIDVLALRYGLARIGPHAQRTPWRRWPSSLVADLGELLAHLRALILRRMGNATDAGSDLALPRTLGMLLLCLMLGELLLGLVLDRPLGRWLAAGITLGLLVGAALSSLLALAWRLVRRAPGWRRVTAPFAYLYGGASLYFCAGAFVIFIGTQVVQPDVFGWVLEQVQRGSEALPAAGILSANVARGPALPAGILADAFWVAGVVWCVRAWAVFCITLGTRRRLAAAAAFLLWVALLAALCALAWCAAA